jgi:hypothetical protein
MIPSMKQLHGQKHMTLLLFYCKEESTMSYYTEEQIQQASIISLSSIEMRINLMWYHKRRKQIGILRTV